MSTNKEFIKEVVKYFMDFLETDFHKRKNPRRSIQIRSNNNLLIGLNLSKYPSFYSTIWKTINQNFDKTTLSTIQKNVYKTNIPKNLVDLVELQTNKITNKQVSKIIEKIANETEKSATLYKDDYDKATNSSVEATINILKEELVSTFITSIEKPLSNLNLGDENNMYLLEEELTTVLFTPLENKIFEIIKHILAKEKIDINKQLKEVVNTEDIKLNIHSFFENYQVGDLFTELYEIERNRTILDKQEFYLYFCDITFNNAKFPIFYIPMVINKENDSLAVQFDSQVYINKKAIEFIIQEYNEETKKKGTIKSISERILYLAQHQENFENVLSNILNEITNFFELDKSIELTNAVPQTAKSKNVRVSNNCYISLFDKSDEALVNDYEEMLELLNSGDNVLAEAFNTLIDDFIHKDPKKYNMEIQEEWDQQDVPTQLVVQSPIPLNEEQLQILSALKKDDCKYIIVQGPPGTGKSHTITAVVFNMILQNQSVLVLSDKKEALDVVEDKITETMNKVRVEDNFQNPVLRLGKTGNAYAKILSPISIKAITTSYLAVKKNYKSVEETIDKSERSLKEDIEAEVLANTEINLNEIQEYFALEKYYEEKGYPIDITEILQRNNSPIELEEFRKIFINLRNKLIKEDRDTQYNNKDIQSLLNFSIEKHSNSREFHKYVLKLNILIDTVEKIKEVYSSRIDTLNNFINFEDKLLDKLKLLLKKYEREKNWLFGYAFKKEKIIKLDTEFKTIFNLSIKQEPYKYINEFNKVIEIFDLAIDLKDKIADNNNLEFDYLTFIHSALTDKETINTLREFINIEEDLRFLETNLQNYPNTIINLEINPDKLDTFCSNKLVDMPDLDFDKLIRFLNLKQKIEKDFNQIPSLNYAGQKKNIENLLTVKMTHIMDGRLVEFWDKYTSTATAIKKIIQNKLKFPQQHFLKLKDAFPCILAGIRDYAEYIPLEPEIFDLVIIDEASQVSIAQALPALLRAKKVLILGDNKQFSNVKTAQARTDENRKYLWQLEDCFKKTISTDAVKIIKLEKFNIKTSILDFFTFISNYNTQLLKHFRGYKEIISYSNKYFYQDSLQVMKIRGKPIDDVIKFSYIEHDGKKELIQNTNTLEAQFIIKELKKLKESNILQSVGIITPHTNQQKILVEMINKVPEKDYFYEKMKLKIMTFDTCQGEERDIIYYSMVATEEEDHLWGVFIKDLSEVDTEEDGKIKAQRLNVGLSRAKETIHFVLSKPIDKYNGSIGEAIRHYKFILEEAKKEKDISEVDEKSKMEPEVMNWFYQTDFWKEHNENIEFIPQFELGKYLKQLDRTYTHPSYKVDFLLIYKDEISKEHKVIIEYDGFREHFRDLENINQFNYQDYYNDSDVYRQKVLESYGYKFLRINKFNIGNNPITILNERIFELIKEDTRKNNILNNIHETIESLQNGIMKECPKCKQVREAEDFKDQTLISGYGRFCKFCKGHKDIKSTENSGTEVEEANEKKCPKCGSKMALRSGRYGKFFGCSRYPYCKGTRPY